MLVQPYLKGKLNHFLYSLFILLVRTEDTSEIFYEDGISFIPLQNWSQGGKYKINTCFLKLHNNVVCVGVQTQIPLRNNNPRKIIRS